MVIFIEVDQWEKIKQHKIEYGSAPPRMLDTTKEIGQRAKVFGGWLVRMDNRVTFVPDPIHEWK